MKKRIICFGDSLTWGFDPDLRNRFDEDIRWPGVLKRCLGDEYVIIEEGQNGRTIATEDPSEGEKNGLKYIGPCMESHKPFDYIIIMLGSNDLKTKFGYSAMDIAGEMQIFIEKVKSFIEFRMENKAKIILISPPHIAKNIKESWLCESFNEKSTEISKKLADWYKQLAEMYDLEFINAADYVDADDSSDACHLTAKNQIKLGEVVAKYISNMENK